MDDGHSLRYSFVVSNTDFADWRFVLAERSFVALQVDGLVTERNGHKGKTHGVLENNRNGEVFSHACAMATQLARRIE